MFVVLQDHLIIIITNKGVAKLMANPTDKVKRCNNWDK